MNPQRDDRDDDKRLDDAFVTTQRLVERALDAIDRDVERHEDRIRELEEFKAGIEGLRNTVTALELRVRTVEQGQTASNVKIGVWGAIATVLAAVGAALAILLNRGTKL